MATQKMNVLVYSGNGSTPESVRHCLYTLRRLLSPTYAVLPITGDVIIKEPWSASCALLVFPGGADLGYCRTLNGEGNRRISLYVNRGGSFLGFCAGGYYGSSRCEFEVNDKKMAVVGDRELEFYPGICRGLAFAGFEYQSEAGTRAADLKINKAAFPEAKKDMKETFKSYYNGGGVFVDSQKLASRGVETLATYTEDLNVDSGDGAAAIVYRKVGEGHVVLTGPHPEFAAANLTKTSKLPSFREAVDQIAATDTTRMEFMRLMLQKLGLKANEEEQVVPSLSPLHLTAHKVGPVQDRGDVTDLVASWEEILTVVDGKEYILGQNDCFLLEKKATSGGLQRLADAVRSLSFTAEKEEVSDEVAQKKKAIHEAIEYTNASTTSGEIPEYDKIIKKIILHEEALPSSKETFNFHHESFYDNLSHYHSNLRNEESSFGKYLLYGEVVTSTNTVLEKNPTLLRHLPTGTTITATQQVAGRGRGSNVWISPKGALMFSTVMHHSFQLTQSAPVIFIQYLAGLATVRGIQNYAPGYDALPVKLKWPNDIYAQVPGSLSNPVVKIGGILVNSSYSGSNYDIVCGIGVNLANDLPTTTLNLLAESHNLRAFTAEKLLASILAQFESLYADFCRRGWHQGMEDEYYKAWLHSGQIVTLETHEGMKARIKGITKDWGLLLAEELGWEDRPTGKMVQLQSDSNSFDFFKGLLRRKV